MSTSASTSEFLPTTVQVCSLDFLTTASASEVPAYFRSTGTLRTHFRQTRASYWLAVMRGGGRPDEEASDAPSSSSCPSINASSVVACGGCSPGWVCGCEWSVSWGVGLSRRLRQDSWYQSLNLRYQGSFLTEIKQTRTNLARKTLNHRLDLRMRVIRPFASAKLPLEILTVRVLRVHLFRSLVQPTRMG
jgi:hypothetical protein